MEVGKPLDGLPASTWSKKQPTSNRPGRAGKSVKSNDGHSKVCSRCDTRKPLDQFYRWSKGADGYQASCKSCQDERLSKYHEENPDKRKEAVW
jgi:hypothetical protein